MRRWFFFLDVMIQLKVNKRKWILNERTHTFLFQLDELSNQMKCLYVVMGIFVVQRSFIPIMQLIHIQYSVSYAHR